MEKLCIECTKSTPRVILDPDKNSITLQGQSYPENAFKFYEPILQWVDEYLAQLDTTAVVTIDFHFPYINTSSSKCLMMLLEKFDEAYHQGKKLTLNWFYQEGNENELDCAEEFKDDLDLPFHLIPRTDE